MKEKVKMIFVDKDLRLKIIF